MDKAVKKKIKKYIETERDISRHLIKRLRRSSKREVSKKRIIDIEKEFLELPLETMGFDNVPDVAAAIAIYRSSRTMFHKTYDIGAILKNETKDLKKDFEKKSQCLDRLADDFVGSRVKEINIVQDEMLYDEFQEYLTGRDQVVAKNLKEKTIEEIIKIEPIQLAKKRARIQASLCSIGFHLSRIVSDSAGCDFEKGIEILDKGVNDIELEMFKYYNFSLGLLSKTLIGSMGENKYLSKLHTLENIMDYEELLKDAHSLPRPISMSEPLSFDEPSITNLLKKDSACKMSFGILFPIMRMGNEKMTMLYKNIYFKGINVTEFFNEQISNVKAYNADDKIEYHKALLLKPISKIENEKLITSLKTNDILPIIEDDVENIVLVPRTRSEEEGIFEILPLINHRVKEVREEYFRC